MTRIPRVTGKELAAALLRAGFSEIASTGGHRHLRRPNGTGRVTIPMHVVETLSPKLVQSILRQAGLTAEELADLL